MSDISTAFKNDYRDNFLLLVQQIESKLMPGVMVDTEVSGEQTFIDQIGLIEFEQLVGRHQETKNTDPEHFRRRLVTKPFTAAPLIDKPDKLRTITDPSSSFSEGVRRGSNRLQDDTIIAAFTGDAFTEKDGSVAVPLPSTQIIAKDFVEGGGAADSNLTVGKVREAKRILDDNDVPEDDRFLALSPSGSTSLLRNSEITSSDFVEVKALVEGRIPMWMGFTFLPVSTRLLKSGDIRSNIAWHRSGMVLGFLENPITRVDELPTKNYSVQVYGRVDLGSTRLEEETVVEILSDETK